MLFHNLRIAWKSLRRNVTLSVLIVAGIALGIAVATTFAAFRHACVLSGARVAIASTRGVGTKLTITWSDKVVASATRSMPLLVSVS